MSRYFALIDGHDGSYGVVFPDLEGAAAMGKSIDEALVNAAEALGDFIGHLRREGLPIPPPRSVELLRADPEVAGALRAGSFLSSVPVIVETARPVRANISLDAGLLEAIDAEAGRTGLTRSAFLASAARDKITGRR